MDQDVLLAERRGPIALLTFNRPGAMNALSSVVNRALIEHLERAEGDDEVRVVVLTGAGQKAFVAGGDIAEMERLDALGAREYALRAKEAVDKIYNLTKPVIAAINGFCLGGGLEYALACDLRVASETAKFALPEISLGIMPGSGGTQRLTRLIGMGRAKELIYTGERFDARTALELGVVNHVYPPEQLLEEALALAGRIATRSPVALRLIKSAVQKGAEMDLDAGMAFEIDCFSLCFTSQEQRQAMAEFVSRSAKR